METVEVVIKIPEELYKAYKGRPPMLGDAGLDMIVQSIANGTVLPKGHGRLIDADALVRKGDVTEDYLRIFAPTILEADKAESEDKE